MIKLSVAGIPIRVESAHPEWAAQRFAAYIREDDRPSEVDLRFTLVDEIHRPEGEVVQTLMAATVMKLPDGRYFRYTLNPDNEIFLASYFDREYKQVDTYLRRDQKHPRLSNLDWEYLQVGYSFQDRLAVLGGGVLHSSSLAWRGNGLAFSADPGTGKSTHVGLWCQRFGDEVTIINDDKPAIVFQGDTPYLCGTPWSGKTALNNNEQVPLKAIVFIERGEENSIRRLDFVESYGRMVSQVARPFYDISVGERLTEFMERLLSTVPIYCLRCNISAEAVETVVKEIFPREDIG